MNVLLPPSTAILDRLASALLATVAVAAIAIVAAAASGVRPHVEASDSMRPALRAGDVVWLDQIDAADARSGDVVAFADPDSGRPVLHRIERIARSGGRLDFVTRGDANTGVERWSIARTKPLDRYAGVRVPVIGRAATRRAPALAVVALTVLLLLRRIWR